MNLQANVFRALLPLALAGVLAASPGARADDGTGVNVLIVGIDGATWRVAGPLVKSGQLPVIRSLIERGAKGPLRSRRPMCSPALWTTIATGYGRDRHGIDNFTYIAPGRDAPVLVNATRRRVPALWDLAGAEGLRSGIVGWWATWPAEPIEGWMVTDRMTRGRWAEWMGASAKRWLTEPEALTGELLDLVVDPADLEADDVREIVKLRGEERAEFDAAMHPVRSHAPSELKFAWAAQRSNEKMMLRLLADEGQPELAAVFLVAVDPISHTFWHHFEPEAFGLEPSDDQARLGAAIPNIYRHDDAYLGRLLDAVDDDTVVVIVSDHGFQPSGNLPTPARYADLRGAFDEDDGTVNEDAVTVGQSGIHQINGVLVVSGGPILHTEVENASILDVAPTVAALLGIPVAEDLPGRVLTEIIDPAFLERHPVRTVPTWVGTVPREVRDVDAASLPDPAAEEMLRSLGYIR
jgi:predicted AlkP superfamily phosphohydrolase/phosphomutase